MGPPVRLHLWQPNHNTRQSPIGGDHDRLKHRENWGQIGTADGDFLHFLSSWRLVFWECIDALLIVVFTSKGLSWGGAQVRKQVRNGGCDRPRARPCNHVNHRAGPGRTAATTTAPSAAAHYH